MQKVSRKSVMNELRKNVEISSFRTFSDKRKNSQRLKIWGVRNIAKTSAEVLEYFNKKQLPGIAVFTTVSPAYSYAQPSIVITFSNKLYN